MKKLLLVGAGHVHLFLLKQCQQTPLPDVCITLLHPFANQYMDSMFPEYAEGYYGLNDICLEVGQATKVAGISWIQEAAMSIDPDQKVVLTDEGKVLDYDAVSFDIGLLTDGTQSTGVLEYAEKMKPNARFPEAVDRMRHAESPVIVGGSTCATEMALSLQTWRNQNNKGPITLISKRGLLEHEIPKAAEKIETLAEQKGIYLHLHDGVEKMMPYQMTTQSRQRISYDSLLWLAGLRPHHLFASSALSVDNHGYLCIEETLQVKRYPSVFGAGDCVSINGYAHNILSGNEKLKQGEILWENLKGFFEGGEGHLYRPKSSDLKVLSLGGRKGFMLYKGKVFYGKWPWLFKYHKDRRLMESYQ